MKQLLKQAARIALHRCAGLAFVRGLHRSQFRVAMFHGFDEPHAATLAGLCAHIARYYEPLPLSAMVDALRLNQPLPANAVTITVDDGYRDFLLYAQPAFRRWRIPSTVYVVSGFSDGRLWLWTDQVRFALTHSSAPSLAIPRAGLDSTLDLSTPERRERAATHISEWLKTLPNAERLQFLAGLPRLTGVDLPPHPPACYAPLSWQEMRDLAAEGVEIGCHTDTHPILSRLADQSQRDREIAGAREIIEQRTGLPVKHFCYPNGTPRDIDDAAVATVQKAGFESSVTCSYGLNTLHADPWRIRRVPLDSTLELPYSQELLAGLHM